MYCINKSGTTLPVYSSNDFTTKIGAIYPNECYVYISTWAGSHVYYPNVCDNILFRGPNGTLMNGCFMCTDITTQRKSVLDYSFGGGSIISGLYYPNSLKARNTLTIYNGSGNAISTVTAGRKVLIGNDNTSGQNYPYLLKIKAVESSAGSGAYSLFAGTTDAYCDTGLGRYGSMYNTVGLYGNW